LDKSRLAESNLLPIDFFTSFSPVFYRDLYKGSIIVDKEVERLKLYSRQSESFWFPLAVGTIGGLIMSVVGIFFFLPIFSLSKKNE